MGSRREGVARGAGAFAERPRQHGPPFIPIPPCIAGVVLRLLISLIASNSARFFFSARNSRHFSKEEGRDSLQPCTVHAASAILSDAAAAQVLRISEEIEQVTQQLQNISGVFWIGCTQTVQMAR